MEANEQFYHYYIKSTMNVVTLECECKYSDDLSFVIPIIPLLINDWSLTLCSS